MYFFKRDFAGSNKISLPQYFSLAIMGEKEGDIILKERLKKLLKIVDVIELEREGGHVHQSIINEAHENGLFQKDEVVKISGAKEVKKKNSSDNMVNRLQKRATAVLNGKNASIMERMYAFIKKPDVMLAKGLVSILFKKIQKN